MKLNSTLVLTVLAGALLLGALAWTPTAEAWQPLCFECIWVPYSGSECIDTYSTGWPSCTVRTHSGTCHVYGGQCNGLTSIER